VDEFQQVRGRSGVWALGDACVNPELPLPPIAQVAQQQATYLCQTLNAAPSQAPEPFKFFSLGAMSQLGFGDGVVDFTQLGDPNHPKLQGHLPGPVPVLTGLSAWLAWRFAYWGKQVSFANKVLIPMHWFKTWILGRDISKF
jgi:NADH dehydrogenase FAD-containing subunit